MKSFKLGFFVVGLLLAACGGPSTGDTGASSSDQAVTEGQCGLVGQECCFDKHPCAGSAICKDHGGAQSVCVASDDAGSSSDDGGTVTSPGQPCGQDGQACCDDDACSGVLVCVQLGDGFDQGGTVCTTPAPTPPPTCGEPGLPCCLDIHVCSSSSSCNDEGICVAN